MTSTVRKKELTVPLDYTRYARDEDVAFFQRELASFVPDRVYDAHCHPDVPGSGKPLVKDFEAGVDHADYVRLMDCMMPGRVIAANFISFHASPEWHARSNEWTARQAARDVRCRGEFFVRPDDDPEWVRQEAKRLGLSGLKCYHLQAPRHPSWEEGRPTWDADICDYLPECLVKVADDEGWVITLHLVKRRAVADPANIHWIRRYCETYPNMKLILAHSARGFQPAHNLEGLAQLEGLENLYFDCSVNCEPIAHQSIIRVFGHGKLMYGSDFPVSHLRGRSLGAADSFLWLYEDTPVWGEKHSRVDPVLIGLEQLRSLKWACWSERLTDSQVEDVFWNNAAALFNVTTD